MEGSQIVMENKPGFLYLLRESLSIPSKNPSFIVFAFFTALPMFYFLIVYEMIFQEIMVETIKIFQERDWLSSVESWMGEFSRKFLLLGFCYLGILHFLDLLNTIAVIDMASFIYTEKKGINLCNMLTRFIKETRLKGPLITSIYVLLLSSLISIGLLSLAVYVCPLSRDVPFLMVFVLPVIALFTKYMEWSAIWDMGILISVLEDKQGDVALFLSSYLSKGSRKTGLILMLAFFVYRLALRLLCLYEGWDKGGSGVGVTAVHATFVCLASVLKWLIFVVYFYDCKKRSLEKKIDEGEGQSTLVVTVE